MRKKVMQRVATRVCTFSKPGHVYISQNVYVNLNEKGGYTDIARKLSDPGDWVVVTDGTYYDATQGAYTLVQS